MRILGVNTAHDASVCLLEDGEIVAFYKEERLSKIKKDSNPLLSTQKILDEYDNIDVIAYGAPSYYENDADNYLQIVKKRCHVENVIDFSQNHHLQHASLAFYNSGFEEAAVLIIDRNGAGYFNGARECETIYHASYPHEFKEVYKNFWVYDNVAHANSLQFKKDNPQLEVDVRSMYSIVQVYETATSLIQQHVLENGKVMGLSAYGNKNVTYHNLFVNGTNIPCDYYFSHELNDGQNHEAVNIELTHMKNKNFSEKNHHIYSDYAWQVQKQTQEAACYLIKKAIEKTGCKNIVISGGYGLNVVANSYYVKQFPNINFYFEPLADDTGNSIGCAMLAHRILTKDMSIKPISHTFYQRGEPPSVNGDLTTLDEICDMLISQKSVAVYKGLAEAGPRALGNRSILFDARNPNAVKIVNEIKKREWYRPFAAMVLQEDAHKYFDMIVPHNKFMTMSFDATEYAKAHIPGIIHVDGSCRIQTIDKSDGIIYDLLQLFKSRTGHSVLLNTSFNLAGAPLVNSADDAIKTLNNSSLDAVWFADLSRVIKNER